MSFRQLSNTDNDTVYPCTTCGNETYTIVRPDPENPRCKCSSCGFVYNGSDSLAAKAAGAIKASSPETLAAADNPEIEVHNGNESPSRRGPESHGPTTSMVAGGFSEGIPRAPQYVFITKDRRNPRVEFCGTKDVKRVALRWHESKHDVYELIPKKFDVKVDIQ